MSAATDTPSTAPAEGSTDVEAVVLQHLRDIRAREAAFPGPQISEDVAVDMAWARYSRTLHNEELAGVVFYILNEHVKPHNVLWAKLREITIRLMEYPKGVRRARRKKNATPDRRGAAKL